MRRLTPWLLVGLAVIQAFLLGLEFEQQRCGERLARIDHAVHQARRTIERRMQQPDYTCLTTGPQTTWAPCLTPEDKAWLIMKHGHHYERE